jgi:hypothetical protein
MKRLERRIASKMRLSYSTASRRIYTDPDLTCI